MKKSMFLRIACILLAVAIITPASTAFATSTDDVQNESAGILRYSDIISITSKLTISPSGKASCIGTVTANSSKNTVEIEMYLRSGITDVKDWSTSGTGAANLNKTWYVTSGSSYYVMVYAYVYDSNGNLLESGSKASNLVTF